MSKSGSCTSSTNWTHRLSRIKPFTWPTINTTKHSQVEPLAEPTPCQTPLKIYSRRNIVPMERHQKPVQNHPTHDTSLEPISTKKTKTKVLFILTMTQMIGTNDDCTPTDKGRYQPLVSKLIYFSHTLTVIGFAVSMISQHMNCPTEEYMEAVYHVWKYLNGNS